MRNQITSGEHSRTILLAAIMVLVSGVLAEAKYCGGTGEPNDPYLICTAEDMNAIGANPDDWGAHFLVICDINLADYTGTQFNIIGDYYGDKPFTGVFDGDDHTISNFTYTTTGTNIGIFGYVDDPNAEIKNLTLIGPNVKAGSGGCLVGRFGDGTISGCGVEGGNVSGSGGLLVGDNLYGTITNCYSTGRVIGIAVGGLVGGNSGTITDCYSDANVSGTGPLGLGCAFGGLVASNSGTIMNCYSTGNISGTFTVSCAGVYVGGLAASNSGTIANCYSDANASGRSYQGGENYVGGLVAYNSSTITDCYSTGNVSGQLYSGGENYIGGLAGYNFYGTITNCYSTGDAAGNAFGTTYGLYYIGGLVGGNDESGTITYCYSTGSVSISGAYAYGFVGGLVGYGGGVVSSFWSIETSGRNTSAGGAHKTTAEMKMASTYIGWGGCDNNDIWTIDDGNDYPHLAWEGKPGQIIGEQRLSDYVAGSGIESDPYLISTGGQLNLTGAFPCEWDKHFKLVADINLAGYTRTQFNIIGRPARPFTGVFDGNDKRIWNFTWGSNGVSYIGLFGYVNGSGQIKNVGLENVNINTANGNYIGGLVGYNEQGTITNCYSTGNVSGTELVGGLVGGNYEGTITNCYSTGNVIGGDFSSYIGGLVGENSGTITNCYSTGSVLGNDHTGGLVAVNSGTITNCHADANVVGDRGVGGLVAHNSGTITNCYSTSNVITIVTADGNFAGGLVGTNGYYGTITNCYSTGSVSVSFTEYSQEPGIIGGLVGYNSGTITNCYSTGSVLGDGYYIGGLVGDNYEGTITNCYATGGVTVVYYGDSVGGLVGDNSGTITNCYSTGTVTGNELVGGLVGDNSSTITNCYSDANVTGDVYVGGLVGYNYGTIENCYSTGKVSGTASDELYIGGLVGDCYGSIISSYFLITSGPDNGYGTPLMDEQMKQQGSFIGWDFVCEEENGTDEIWTIKETVDYPKLVWDVGCFPCWHEDYDDWLSAGKPPCWCHLRQCHGDADNQKEGSTKTGYYYVHFADLTLLQSAWNIKEPPRGPGIAWPDPNICADFDHKAEGNTKTGYFRCHFNDLAILLSSWNIKEPPDGQGIDPNCNCLGYCP